LHVFDQDQQGLNRVYPHEKDSTPHRVIEEVTCSEY
jgi:hypothetical protein